MMMSRILAASACALAFVSTPGLAYAGPPFLTDDPDPTPEHHFEVFVFGEGHQIHDSREGAIGVEINYGAARDVQLAIAIPVEFESPARRGTTLGLGNIDLAAKVLVAHQETSGLNVAIYPHITLPSDSDLGADHASVFLPIWFGRSGDLWSVFGGGGCAINRGGDAQDYCALGLAGMRRLGQLQVGAEMFHQGADAHSARPSTIAGVGLTYDVSEHVHLMSYAGAELEHRAQHGTGTGYASILFTF